MPFQNCVKPGPGQESVWDYPRPPRLEPSTRHIQVIFNKIVIADTRQAVRILETSHPPVYYIPPADVHLAEYFTLSRHTTFCEWKGYASYYDLEVNGRLEQNVAWTYPDPVAQYAALRDYIAFYPARMDQCLVDGEPIQAQAGDFYGGWITSDIVGPFKGG